MEGTQIHLLSDTHNRHKHFTMPGGDILIHAGDISGRGHSGEILPFLDWYADQDYSHLILIAGNHDFGFEKEPGRYEQECKDRGIILLNDSGYDADGIKIWGSPISPWFHNWAFNRERGDEITHHWDMIPDDTEILVTHGPPLKILDQVNNHYSSNSGQNVGCYDLGRTIDTRLKKLKLHVFGHIHEARGYKYLNGVTYVNASALDEYYAPVQGVPFKVVKDVIGEYFVMDPECGDES